MEALTISHVNPTKAQSSNVYTVTRRTQEDMEKAIRENYDLLDQMEPGMNMGAFPYGYSNRINTTR